ncbi:MAG: cell division protein FtsI/penicillin-binding protein 2, partial [Myxococcota bacterium]
APGSSDAKVNLFGVQPIEVVKLAFVVFLAASLGRNAAQLRYQRSKLGFFHAPRLGLLLPALGLTVALFLLMFTVRDLGPTLILSAVLVAFYYAVVRSWVEVSLIIGAVVVGGLAVVFLPLPFLPDNVVVRAEMLRDPWLNGNVGGDQLASGLWAMAAGGLTGQGWGQAAFGTLPAGHTDLILAHLAEVTGLAGLGLYTLALFALIAQAGWIAARNRTPERVLLAFGIAALLLAQWAIIFAGTLGVIPLTGVVVPFLSFGKSSMILFLVAAGLLGRLAADGRAQAELDELAQLRPGVAALLAVALVTGGLLGSAAGVRVLLAGAKTSARGVLTIGYDDTVFFRYDPRIRAIAAQIPRGEIRDRDGVVLAGNDEDGRRSYPLGEAMGTLLGPSSRSIGRPSWALEELHEVHLRGLDDIEEPLAVYIEQRAGRLDRILFTVSTDEMKDRDLAAARRQAADDSQILFTRVRRVDYTPLVRLLHLKKRDRAKAIAKLAAQIDDRSVTTTIDADLQRAAAAAARGSVSGTGLAAAAVVIDVDTGEVLARAQWPDYNPADTDEWFPKLRSSDPSFMGSYGPWVDKTGIRGLYQAGSIFKIFTSVAAVRQPDAGFGGRRCAVTDGPSFDCTIGPECQGRPCVSMPDWSKPIHDGHKSPDGRGVGLVEALEVSCNVYFAQLGLDLGPEAFVELEAAGMSVDAGTFSPGAAGSRQLASTAYGQGAARMHPLQAARMVAAVGADGIYRTCPPSMERGADCAPSRVFPAGAGEPILSGMKKVIESGTARSFADLQGVRVYGKTGTATDPGRSDEAPYGIDRGSSPPPHSWFVALAEPGDASPCEAGVSRRLAVAAVVPRGGGGSGAARELAQAILSEANQLGYFQP